MIFKASELFTMKNRSRFSGITFADTTELYKGTSIHESKNKCSSIEYNTILQITYDHLNALKYLTVYIS